MAALAGAFLSIGDKQIVIEPDAVLDQEVGEPQRAGVHGDKSHRPQPAEDDFLQLR
jgi:hypothetical protein